MTKLSISAVERDTGLPKDTLRVWERRYGFPCPERDSSGERLYPIDQVERLRVIRRLVDLGHRPGKVVGLPVEALRKLASSAIPGSGQGAHAVVMAAAFAAPKAAAAVAGLEAGQDPDEADFGRLLAVLKGLKVDELRQALAQAAWRIGLERFVTRLCAPLTRRVGEAWACGEIEIYEEHLYTEAVQGVLRSAVAGLAAPAGGPRVLLATFPLEVHGLGLLMVEALLALEGCRCTSLGTQTPVVDIARAAIAQPVDIVALSFSPCLPGGQVTGGLAQLRALLPQTMEIWAGGSSAALRRRAPEGIVVLDDLAGIRGQLEAWRGSRRG
ncbi:MAG TPA: MerR family transcriptional regulator [Quisquiliibacterium sp.]|nr:MerR family transcriptional regulator [Quisquiliibacterium sp.]